MIKLLFWTAIVLGVVWLIIVYSYGFICQFVERWKTMNKQARIDLILMFTVGPLAVGYLLIEWLF